MSMQEDSKPDGIALGDGIVWSVVFSMLCR